MLLPDPRREERGNVTKEDDVRLRDGDSCWAARCHVEGWRPLALRCCELGGLRPLGGFFRSRFIDARGPVVRKAWVLRWGALLVAFNI